MITDKINFRQPKYMLPLIIYLPLLGAGYFIFDLFDTELAEVPTQMQTTEYLNPELPEAQIRNDGIGGRYESMVKSYGRIQDYSAVENIERDDNNENREDYDSKYSEEDIAMLDSEAAQRTEELERLREMQERLRQSAEKGESMKNSSMVTPLTEEERILLSRKREQEALAALDKALAEARLQGKKGVDNVNNAAQDLARQDSTAGGTVVKEKVEINERSVTSLDGNDESQAVTKMKRPSSSYFNTLAENEPEIPEVTAVDYAVAENGVKRGVKPLAYQKRSVQIGNVKCFFLHFNILSEFTRYQKAFWRTQKIRLST